MRDSGPACGNSQPGTEAERQTPRSVVRRFWAGSVARGRLGKKGNFGSNAAMASMANAWTGHHDPHALGGHSDCNR